MHNIEQTMKGYSGASSDDDEDDGHNHNEYLSEDDGDHNQVQSKKIDHQLEWDDAAIEYGPKKV